MADKFGLTEILQVEFNDYFLNCISETLKVEEKNQEFKEKLLQIQKELEQLKGIKEVLGASYEDLLD